MTMERAKGNSRYLLIRRLSRFTTRTLFLVVTLVCVGLAWHSLKTRQRQRAICDGFVDSVLLKHHWEIMETDPQLSKFQRLLLNDLTAHPSYEYAFLRPQGVFNNGASPDAFEKKLLAKFTSATGGSATRRREYAERGTLHNSSYVYYRAVRAKKICLACHRDVLGPAPLMKQGDLMAVVKVNLSD